MLQQRVKSCKRAIPALEVERIVRAKPNEGAFFSTS